MLEVSGKHALRAAALAIADIPRCGCTDLAAGPATRLTFT